MPLLRRLLTARQARCNPARAHRHAGECQKEIEERRGQRGECSGAWRLDWWVIAWLALLFCRNDW